MKKLLLLLVISAGLAFAEPVELLGTITFEDNSYKLIVIAASGEQKYRLIFEDTDLKEKAKNLQPIKAKVKGDLRGPNLTVWDIQQE